MPTPDQIRESMQAYVKAMCDSDIDAIMALYADECSVEDPVGGTVQTGRETIHAFYAASAPSIRVELTGPIRVAGNECAMPLLAELTTPDATFYIDVIDVMKVDDDGRITSMRAFWNPAELRPNR